VFGSNAPGTGRLAVRLPGPDTVSDVRLDGRSVSYDLQQVGADRYVQITTSWGPHEMEILLR
jgi:hypothetical protein